MMRSIAEGVRIRESRWTQRNTVVVQGPNGVLLIDPGIHGDELGCLATDLADAGQTVLAGFATHPHWDHLLWHERFGAAPRYGTERCAATAQARLAGGIDAATAKAVGIPGDVPLDLLGQLTALPAGATEIPWDGPRVRIIEHQAHAPGHASLVIEERGVLFAADMVSDVLIPMLDLAAVDPIGDHLAALQLLENAADGIDVIVPGHGAIGGADDLHARIALDRAYLHALRDGDVAIDPRIGPSAKEGWEWVAGVHARQVQVLAA